MTASDAASRPKISEQLADDIQAAVEKTFLQMFALEVKASFEAVNQEVQPSGDVSGIISLIQGEQVGSLIVTFPQATLFNILKVFYKREFTEVDRVVGMAVGEISNIIFGVFKYRVGQKGFSFNMVVPNVAVGSSRVSGTNWTLVGKFTSPQGDFTVLLSRGADLK